MECKASIIQRLIVPGKMAYSIIFWKPDKHYLFKNMLVSLKDFDTALLRSKWPNVPDSHYNKCGEPKILTIKDELFSGGSVKRNHIISKYN